MLVLAMVTSLVPGIPAIMDFGQVEVNPAPQEDGGTGGPATTSEAGLRRGKQAGGDEDWDKD